MAQNNIPPPPPGFEIVGAGAPPPPAPIATPRPAIASRPAASRYSGPMPTSADEVFASLIAQESGGRAGVRGPDTKYGNALGRTQVLPDTARGIAKNLGIPYREDLLTGTSPEAAAYQDQLGRAYLEEGFKNTGNAREALMYYHGGPDRALWGPKTNAYADEVLSRWSQGGGVDPVDAAASAVQAEAPPPPPPPPGFEIQADATSKPAKPGSTPATAIDLSTARYQDEIDALKKGAWVREKGSDKPYQLEADAFPDAMRPIDRPQGGNIAVRPPNLEDRIGAVATAASEQIPGLDELTALTTGAITGEGYGAMREAQMLNRERLNQTERGARNVGGILGVGATLGFPISGAGYIARGGGQAAQAARAAGNTNLAAQLTRMGQIGRTAQVGGATGAAFGLGNTDGGAQERAVGTVAGGLIGAGTAGTIRAGAPVIDDVARRIGSGFSEAGSVVARGFGRAPKEAEITPQATESAAEYVRRLIESSGSDIANNPIAARGKPITAAEAIGPSGVANMTALTRRAGRSSAMVQDVIGARALEQSARVLDDLANASGLVPGAAEDAISSIAKTSREAASPLYDAAYAATNVDSSALRGLMSRPSVKTAMNKAVGIAREEGRNPEDLGFVVTRQRVPGGGWTEEVSEIRTPSMQTWDYVKRGMDDVLEAYRDPTTRRMNLDTAGRAAESTRQALRRELTNTEQPWGAAYRAALDAGGDAPRVEAAFREGPNLFSSSVNERTFRNRVDGMNEVQRSSTLSGIVDDLYNKSRNGRLNLKQLRTAASREKLSLLMGRDAADDFITRLADEASLAQTGGRMAPGSNSTTFEALEAARDQDRSVGIINDLARNVEATGPIGGTLKTALEAAYAPLGGFLRGAASPASQPVRDEIGRLLARSPQDLIEELRALNAARGSSTQAPAWSGLATRGSAPASGQAGAAVAQRDAQTARRSGTR